MIQKIKEPLTMEQVREIYKEFNRHMNEIISRAEEELKKEHFNK